jgi:hypothetical protein
MIAGAMYYAIWWQVDPWIFMTFMLKTPVVQPIPDEPDLESAAELMFRITPERPAADPEVAGTTDSPRWTGRTAAAVITTVAYSWLTIATISCCALALAGAASLSRSGGPRLRVLGAALAVLLATGLIYGGYWAWSQYSMGFKVVHLRVGMAGLAALCAAIGLIAARWLTRMTRLASLLTILAAAASVIGLYLWVECGAVEPKYATPGFLALVFLVHSFWAWVLLAVSFRLPGLLR